MLQIPELLSPAGDLERLRYAINYGADAVYCSLPEFGQAAIHGIRAVVDGVAKAFQIARRGKKFRDL